jgi:hypothetical protein
MDFLSQDEINDQVERVAREKKIEGYKSAIDKLHIMWKEATELTLVNKFKSLDNVGDYISQMDKYIKDMSNYIYIDSFTKLRETYLRTKG